MQGSSRLNEKEKINNESMIKCKHCAKDILGNNYLIHEARCGLKSSNFRHPLSEVKKQAPEVKPAQSYFNQPNVFRPEVKKSEIGQKPQVSSVNYQSKPRIFEKKKEQEPQFETIPCHFCGYQQTLEQLDTHPLTCQHREEQCPECNQMFPRSLMDDHLDVCANRIPEEPQEPYEHHHNHHHGFNQLQEPFNPFGNLQNLFGMMRPMERRRSQEEEPHQFGEGGNGMFVIQSTDSNGNITRRILSGSGNGGNRSNPFANFLALLQRHVQRHGEVNKGLTKQEMKDLKRTVYKGNNEMKQKNEKDLCTICYCQFEKEQKLIELKCKHIYHEECITKWVQNTAKCPVCKTALTDRPIFEDEEEEDF